MSGLWLPPGTELGHRGDGWVQIADHTGIPGARTYVHRGRGLMAIVSRELDRWHMSVSHRDRMPTWGELGFARDELLPEDVFLCVPHPPRRYWMNLNHRVLHLWEMKDDELREQFRWEGSEAQGMGIGEPSDDVRGGAP